MGANDKVAATFHDGSEHVCAECDLIWNSEAAADRCCEDDGLTVFDASRNRLSYRLSYD